ncbi:hypothetical protein SUGI_0403060 [Cryptomeria japonica]|nr:hypothetical protein SUGI_0403060 [Cryptomeria japonica]
MRPFSAMLKAAFRLMFSSQQRLDCQLGYCEFIINDNALHGYRKFKSIVKIDAKEVVKQRNMGEGWVLRRNISITRIGAQQLRGFLGVGDGDEDSGLSKTYEERCVKVLLYMYM